MSSINVDLTNAPPEVLAMLANMSAIPAPDDVVVNLVNPSSRGDMQIIVSSVILAISMLFFINRVYTKLFLMRKLSWDDATITIAVLSIIAYFVSTVLVAKNGVGTHLWNLSVLKASKTALLIPTYMNSTLTPFAFLWLKSTFFILYLQLFAQYKHLRILSWSGLGVCFGVYTGFTIAIFYYATPSRGSTWFAHQTSENMKKDLALSVPQSIFGLVIDLWILLIPILGVVGLKMSLRRKIGVLLIFLSGIMACICSACSIYYRVQLDHTLDSTWILVAVNLCTLSEMFVGVICACIPAAAYAARQEHSPYRKLFNSLNSLTLSRGSIASTNEKSNTTQVTEANLDVLKSTDRKYAQYFNLTDTSMTKSAPREDSMASTQTSYIDKADREKIMGPGIVKQFDIDIESGRRV